MVVAILQAVLTALLASVFTLLLGKLALDRWGRELAKQWLAQAAETVEQRVRAGAEAAGRDLMPEVRTRVREGVEDAVVALASGSPMGRSLLEIQRGGAAALVERLFGRKRE